MNLSCLPLSERGEPLAAASSWVQLQAADSARCGSAEVSFQGVLVSPLAQGTQLTNLKTRHRPMLQFLRNAAKIKTETVQMARLLRGSVDLHHPQIEQLLLLPCQWALSAARAADNFVRWAARLKCLPRTVERCFHLWGHLAACWSAVCKQSIQEKAVRTRMV